MMFGQPQQGATQPGPQASLHPTVDFGQPGGQQHVQSLPMGQQFGPPQMGFTPSGYTGYDPSMVPPPPQQQGQPQGGYFIPAPGRQQPQQQGQQPPQQYQYGYAPQQPVQGGYPQQQAQYQQAQYQQPQQGGYPMQQPQQPGYISPNTVLDGPGVPAELRGRTMQQAMSIYSQLASDFIRRQNALRTGYSQQTQQPQQQGGYQQQGQQTQQQGFQAPRFQQGQQGQQGSWRDDIRQEVQQAVAPLVQQTTKTSIAEAISLAASQVPDWQNLQQDVVTMLQNADPASLMNPDVWVSAADLVRGKRGRMSYGQQQPGQGMQGQLVQTPYGLVPLRNAPQPGFAAVPQQQYGMQSQQYGQQPYAGMSVPAGQYMLPQYQFFTEGPTPPAVNSMSNLLTPQEREYARKMQMDDATYLAWRGGVIR